MAPHDSQGLLLVASACVIVLGFILAERPWAARPSRREVVRLRAAADAGKTRIDRLNHELYHMQSIVETVRPHYERAQRLRAAINEMKRVWLAPDSGEAERAHVLRKNLWVLTPHYRDICLTRGTADALEATALRAAPDAQTDDPVHLRIAFADRSITAADLEQAQASVFKQRAGVPAMQRVECLLLGTAKADGVRDLRLSWGGAEAGAIRIHPITYGELIAQAELLANPPLDHAFQPLAAQQGAAA